jgi:hypothetical protein
VTNNFDGKRRTGAHATAGADEPAAKLAAGGK